MAGSLLLNLSALAALVPAAVVPAARQRGRDVVYWAVVLLAVAGPAGWAAAQLADSWHTGVSVALWLTIAVTMAVFAVVAVIDLHAWRLTPLLRKPAAVLLRPIAFAASPLAMLPTPSALLTEPLAALFAPIAALVAPSATFQ